MNTNRKWSETKIPHEIWLDPFHNFDPSNLNWAPFTLVEPETRADPPRSLRGPFGVADRLRWVAFAEFQAARGFFWATTRFPDAPEDLRADWLALAHEEAKHLNWILLRMKEIHVTLNERRVNTDLWLSFVRCTTPREFSLYMANAEERGRESGELFAKTLMTIDPITSELFQQIAVEEKEHVKLATRHFPDFEKISSQYSIRL